MKRATVSTSLYEQINPVFVLDLQSASTLFSLSDIGRGSDFLQSVFSPDGHWVGTVEITWDGPYQLKVYDTATRKLYKSMPLGEDIPSISLAFNSTGDLIAVGRANGEILLIDINEMEVVATLSSHHGAVDHLVFSPDGLYLISGSNDGTIRIWGLP